MVTRALIGSRLNAQGLLELGKDHRRGTAIANDFVKADLTELWEN